MDGRNDPRYGTIVEEGCVYVGSPDGRLEIGSLDHILDIVGGPAWTVRYGDQFRERHPESGTDDEGLTVAVAEVVGAMEHGPAFVETLAACPTEGPDDFSPRMGVFVGKLLDNLQRGLL